MNDRKCPAREELSLYFTGRLRGDRVDRIEEHLPHCPACQQEAQFLEAGSDSLIPALIPAMNGQLGEDRFLEEEDLRQALAVVRKWADGAAETESLEAAAGTIDESSAAGVMVGPYQVLEKIGQGGMGAVYRAVHTKLDRVVALKLLPRRGQRSPDALARFEREIKAAGKLDHPNIVRASDADVDQGVPYLAMEYVAGLDLAELSRRVGPLPTAEACELLRQAALGLQHAHDHGLVHRDVKPSNLMLSNQGQLKILDLGLALLADEGDAGELTRSGLVMGTWNYMAPEQHDDSHRVDGRADVYGLGATLYKLLIGEPLPAASRRPGEAAPHEARLHAVETMHRRRPDAPPALSKVVRKMTAQRPEDRYACPADAAAELARFARGADPARLFTLDPASAPQVLPPAEPREPHRRGAIFTSLIGLAVLGLAVLSVAASGALGLFLDTPYGTLRIEIHDPKIEVLVRQSGAVIRGADRRHEIHVEPGEHGLIVTRGDLQFTTHGFQLRRGETTRLDIQLLAGELQVVRDGRLLDRRPLPKPAVPQTDPPKAVPPPVAPPKEAPPEQANVPTQVEPVKPEPLRTVHGNPVVQVLFTPDGKHLAAAGNGDHHTIRGNTRYHTTGRDNCVQLWEVETRIEKKRFFMTEAPHYGPQGIDVSPDGRLLTAACGWIWANGPSHPRVYVWDLATGERKHLLIPDGNHSIRTPAFSADGKSVLAVQSGSGGIHRWLLADGQLAAFIPMTDTSYRHEAPRLTWSPDRRWILCGAWASRGPVWACDATTGELAKELENGHLDSATQVVASPDGRYLLSGSRDSTVRVWDFASTQELLRVDLKSPVHAVAYSTDGLLFASGLESGEVVVHASSTGAVLARFPGHSGHVRTLCFSPSAPLLATGGEDGLIFLREVPK